MSQELWDAVDGFIQATLLPPDPDLDGALEASRKAGLPAIAVSPPQGRMLHILAKLSKARRVLEIGTLGGYSTLWMAKALPPDGRVVTLEADPRHAEVARGNFERAGFGAMIELRQGRALELLPGLQGPFDLSFIDADKPSIPEYFDWALKLSKPGSLIVVDNVVREGALADATSADPAVHALRRFHERLGRDPRLSATSIQTVGSKGHDGFTLALVLG